MSISNTVSKVEEFDASSKSLDATQLYLGEIGFSPHLYLLLKKKSFTPAEHCVVMKRLVSA